MLRTIRWGLTAALVALAVANPAAADVGDNQVGMNIHYGHQAYVDACADLGLGWVRMDANWFALEPSSDDNYQWSSLDAAIGRANAAGLQVYLTLAYTPDWVPRHGDTDGSSHNDIPNDASYWQDFVEDAVAHFSGPGLNVTHFGIWNEPNLDGFLEGGHNSLGEYVSIILEPGAAAVRSACASCKVLGPDLAHVGDVDDYMEALFDLIPTSTFDIFAHHSYNGFPETGVNIWDGDRYFEVLDQQRFKGTPLEAFTRRSLRDLLDEWGFSGEVWMTETGYQAEPPGDATEENFQALHTTLVLDEQLLRDWVTNTFFYEIHDCGPDQPTCPIDGFGLMRANAGAPPAGSRTFDDDFRLKPAFHALKQYIIDHPQIVGSGQQPECSDGQDNDLDGFADAADRGCDSATDTDESDDPPRARLWALPAGSITVDGDLSDFGSDGWVEIDADDWRSPEPLGTDDLGVRAAARWSSSGLYLAFEVTDEAQDNDHIDAELWLGDSIQLGFDVGQSGGGDYDDLDDHELNFALVGGQARSYRYWGPNGANDAFEVAVVRAGSASPPVTRYEIWLPQSALPAASFALDQIIGFSFLVNDADGAGRAGWMEWTAGIGSTKTPYYFGEVGLTDEIPQPDGGVGGGAGTGAGGNGGAAAGGSGSGASAAAGSGANAAGDSGGCGCRTHPSAAWGASWMGLALLWLWARRRSRARRRN